MSQSCQRKKVRRDNLDPNLAATATWFCAKAGVPRRSLADRPVLHSSGAAESGSIARIRLA
jgi:hypothetical protein